jgi:8-oxo-dGTP diphosphatase
LSLPEIKVVAAALIDTQGRVLIAQRLAGSHMAGAWEFPGGKLENGKSASTSSAHRVH